MNLKDRKKLAYKVAVRVWGRQPASARLGKARRMIESLLEEDELLLVVSGVDAKSHIEVIFDEAIRRLQEE